MITSVRSKMFQPSLMNFLKLPAAMYLNAISKVNIPRIICCIREIVLLVVYVPTPIRREFMIMMIVIAYSKVLFDVMALANAFILFLEFVLLCLCV